jgi:hypothetical protein
MKKTKGRKSRETVPLKCSVVNKVGYLKQKNVVCTVYKENV